MLPVSIPNANLRHTALQEPKRDGWMDRQLAARETLHGRTATGGGRGLRTVWLDGERDWARLVRGTRSPNCLSGSCLVGAGYQGSWVVVCVPQLTTEWPTQSAHPLQVSGSGWPGVCPPRGANGPFSAFGPGHAYLKEGWIRGLPAGVLLVGWSYHGLRFDRYGWTECRWDAGALLMVMLMFASLSVQEVSIGLCLVRVRGPIM